MPDDQEQSPELRRALEQIERTFAGAYKRLGIHNSPLWTAAHSREPVSRPKVGALGVALTLALYLWHPGVVTIIACCAGILGCLVYATWDLPWISAKSLRRLAVLIVLAVAVAVFGTRVYISSPPPRSADTLSVSFLSDVPPVYDPTHYKITFGLNIFYQGQSSDARNSPITSKEMPANDPSIQLATVVRIRQKAEDNLK
ncbi:MAG: hypothetical protein WBX26_02550, partial [Candidatus Cybelea sp.]